MKKVLIGICGIGNGHVNRQMLIIEELRKRGCQIVIATTPNKIETIKNKFSDIEVISINIPWIVCGNNGVDFSKCKEVYIKNNVDQYLTFFNFSLEAEKRLNGKPDLVISDYEPNVAQYAYACGVKLINMEQQSKFLYLKEESIKGYSINEEVTRLNYFFPKTDYRIISSFFNVNINEKNAYIIPPVIRTTERTNVDVNKGLVYFSPYCNDKKQFIKILKLLKQIKNLSFIVYTSLEFEGYCQYGNVVFKKFGEDFLNDLKDAYFIISSSGHQLLSESISADIPVYLFPLKTYEQHYNSRMIEKYDLGIEAIECTKKEFDEFYNNIPKYIRNMKEYRKKEWTEAWSRRINKIFDEIL